MATHVLTTSNNFTTYDHWIKNHLHGSLWQSLEWKEYQEALGREVWIYVVEDSSKPSPYPSPLKGRGEIVASALVVVDRTMGGWSTWDIPRGPLSDNRQQLSDNKLFETIVQDAKKDKCMSLYCSPPFAKATAGKENLKLKTSHRHEQPEATRMIDLTQSDDRLLKQMKPKGRYNISVALKHGTLIQESQNIDAFYQLLHETSHRDGFKTLPKSHYKAFLEDLPGSFLLLAYQSPPPHPPPQGGVPHKAIAGLLGVIWGTQGIYYYGASDYAYRANMAPYLLQWAAMRYCKARGCRTYDLLGIVLPVSLALRRRGREYSHPWAGVSKFKEQFGGTVIEYPPEQEIVLRPWVKRALELKRRFL